MLVTPKNLKKAGRENLLGDLNEFQSRVWGERGGFEYASISC
jgi:hypothetical protein